MDLQTKVSVSIINTDDDKTDTIDPEKMCLSDKIFDIMLNSIIFGYNDRYQKEDYWLLLNQIYKLVDENKIMKFLLPAFPVKSPNKDQKVLGTNVDFAESIAIDNLLSVARKIQGIYEAGVKFIIMSDYHTFDQYIQVDEESYNIYHQGLKNMIKDKGADDVIDLINLSYFKEFENVPEGEISTSLGELFGGEAFRKKFDDQVKSNPELLKKYTQQLKFFKKDLSHILRLSPNSKRKVFLKHVVTGAMSQGVALDAFLRQQNKIKDYIRLSIHHHQPESGKFAVDLFKNKCYVANGVQLRTPWHNTVVLDTLNGHYYVDTKEESEKEDSNSKVVIVNHNGEPWLYLKLYLNEGVSKEDLDLQISLIKHSCGLVVESPKSKQTSIKVLKSETIKTLINEFGIVLFRGFKEFEVSDDFLSFYENHLQQKPLVWEFGPVYKVTPDKNMPGNVNSHQGLPIHWDLTAPPKYMGIDQDIHKYEDFTCPIFALYCRSFAESHTNGDVEVNSKANGATIFVDATAATLSIHGRTNKSWKQLYLKYETELAKEDEDGSQVHFGGKGNTYTYPLIHQCPNHPDKDVLRWWQDWTKEEFPKSKQFNHSVIASYPKDLATITKKEIEEKVREIAFDERFFFSHQYDEGDLVFVNNYTTLHGRNPFNHGVQRELWRIQSIPVSDNIPEYFKL